MTNTMNNTEKQHSLPVAEMKPGDFPVGSIESRAAARMLAERKKAAVKQVLRIQFVSSCDVQSGKLCKPRLIRRTEGVDVITEFWDCADCSDDAQLDE
jgi:hypothetical protein